MTRHIPHSVAFVGLAALLGLATSGCETEPITPPSAEQTPIVADQDEDIETRLADASTELEVQIGLYDAIGTEGVALEVDIEGGVATLSGTVPDAATAEEAVAAVRDFEAVTEVIDRIEVVDGAPAGTDEAIADRALASRVRLQLLEKLGADLLDVDVSAQRGRVTLSGTVASEDVAEAARALAATFAGVDEVDNRLETTPQEENP